MQSGRDVDIRPPRLSHVGNSSLDGIVRPELYKRTTTDTISISAESPSKNKAKRRNMPLYRKRVERKEEEGGQEHVI
jgi:hypothetical protein